MGDEVRPVVIRKTQESLGKFIKRPPLTEKLLKKPPFRFLHDIITAVIRQHGFLEGLFTADEMISDNVKDKERKIAFLQKVIDTMKLLTPGPPLAVKPSKIVAGQEADKTNELLQAIAKALEKKINSKKAVEQVLLSQEGGVKQKTKEVASKPSKDGAKTKSSKEKSKEPKHEVNGKPRKKDLNKQKEKKSDVEAEQAISVEPSAPEHTPESQTPRVEQALEIASATTAEIEPTPATENKEPSGSENKEAVEPNISSSPSVLGAEEIEQLGTERPPSAAASRVPTAMSAPTPRPPSARPGSARPRPLTARPAAPRLKERLVRPAAEPMPDAPITGSTAVVLIPDTAKEDGDDENFVVEETTPVPQAELVNNNPETKTDLLDTDQAGHLVTQILGTQRELEQDDSAVANEDNSHWPGGGEAARREVNKLRESVQSLVRAANPLGRLLDFLQEDVEAMQLELEFWQSENQQLRVQLSKEIRITEDSLAPLRRELLTLQNELDQQKQACASLKSAVLISDKRLTSALLD